jgi:hypothetical protein
VFFLKTANILYSYNRLYFSKKIIFNRIPESSSCRGYKSLKSDRVHEEVRKKLVEDLIEVVTIDDEEQLNVKSSPDTKPNSTKKSFWKMLTGSS